MWLTSFYLVSFDFFSKVMLFTVYRICTYFIKFYTEVFHAFLYYSYVIFLYFQIS